MLTVTVNNTQWAIPLNEVQYVDYTENLTLLPFTVPPIEGLTTFNHQPILQVNLAQALGFDSHVSDKRVIVTTVQGDIALRVDEILDFVDHNTANEPPPLLVLTEILTGFETTNVIKLKPPATTDIPSTHLTALLVTMAAKTVALSSHIIDHIEEIHDFQSLDYKETQPDLLIKVKDDLLPAYSLSRFLAGDTSCIGKKAVIMQGAHGSWALVVEQVLALENIYRIYTTGTDTHALWYVAKTGEIREIIDANQLIGEVKESKNVPITQPQWRQPFVQMAEQLSSEGLRVDCGSNSYVLPTTIVQSTLDGLDHSSVTQRRFPTLAARSNHKVRVPWINGERLLTGKDSTLNTLKYLVLITFLNQEQILLAVDHVLLQPMLAAEAWSPLTCLPFPTNLFFDAAMYNEKTGQWILRVKEQIKFSQLPWSIKKAFVAAIAGWVDLETITQQQ